MCPHSAIFAPRSVIIGLSPTGPTETISVRYEGRLRSGLTPISRQALPRGFNGASHSDNEFKACGLSGISVGTVKTKRLRHTLKTPR